MPFTPRIVRFAPHGLLLVSALVLAAPTGLRAQDMAPMRAERVLIFFPPNPPPLGRPVGRSAPVTGRMAPPPELASYVSEFFYPALSTRLVTGTLNEKLRTRLDAYREAKLTLQSELRSELERLRASEPAERLQELVAFSRRQTPKIVELEKTAEQLRLDLIAHDKTWTAQRQWHLGEKQRRGFSPIEIAQVMRAYAFYEPGLLPAQRRLLREISIELQFAGENTTTATAAQPFLFFPPEPARVLLPEDLPADIAAKVATYQTKKSVLKKELYDAVHASDGAGFLRAKPIRSIAGQQQARLAELDALAEDIRRGLQATPAETLDRSPLPRSLDARVLGLIAGVREAQRQAVAKLEAAIARARDLPLQVSYRFDPEGLRFVVVPGRGGGRRGRGPEGPTPETLRRIDETRAEISSISEEYGRQLAELVNEKDAIHREIGQTLSLAKREEIDRLLMVAMRRAGEKEAESMFSEYRVAVFEPGLSPEQRRLLFDGVVERLDLPLPRGEMQPTMRGDEW